MLEALRVAAFELVQVRPPSGGQTDLRRRIAAVLGVVQRDGAGVPGLVQFGVGDTAITNYRVWKP